MLLHTAMFGPSCLLTSSTPLLEDCKMVLPVVRPQRHYPRQLYHHRYRQTCLFSRHRHPFTTKSSPGNAVRRLPPPTVTKFRPVLWQKVVMVVNGGVATCSSAEVRIDPVLGAIACMAGARTPTVQGALLPAVKATGAPSVVELSSVSTPDSLVSLVEPAS